MKRPLRVGCSPLTGNIYCGRISKDGQTWSGEKHDVTSDCIAAIIHKIGVNQCITVSENGNEKYEITVKEIWQRAPTSQPTECGYCSFEEADGELVEQCSRCKAVDAEKVKEALTKAEGKGNG